MAFGTLFYAAAAAVQVHLMSQASKDSAAQVDRLAKSSEEAIRASVKASSESIAKSLNQNKASFDTAIKQEENALRASERQSKAVLDASIAANVYELRPYVSPARLNMIGDFLGEDPFEAQAEIVNSGRTPAVKVDSCVDFLIKPYMEKLREDQPCPAPDMHTDIQRREMVDKHTVAYIGASATPVTLHTGRIQLNMVKDNKIVGGGERGAIFSGEVGAASLRLYFYGKISYNDLLGTTNVYTTTFCGIYNPKTKLFDVCETHNKVE